MSEIINCPECKYYSMPVCTYFPWLPIVSRKGYCYHAVRGKHPDEIPVVKREVEMRDITATEIIEDVCEEICKNYCRYAAESIDDQDELDSHCQRCPLNRL